MMAFLVDLLVSVKVWAKNEVFFNLGKFYQ